MLVNTIQKPSAFGYQDRSKELYGTTGRQNFTNKWINKTMRAELRLL